ncbi:tRNA pseudouridine55 synthase [Raineyella antarctica]|uniref:tRNA pseudouridine synthase B n=1 Tax=Raineyella antarctica TaxID=1577474 RepID=A0A1G6HAG9_9ACTN|nr:tRNA pseudouridine(55) synthase TruB [Raineyella antarctica]SDB91289.1 tRNA pseudouridine55 synthase [Raineyella antarctica]
MGAPRNQGPSGLVVVDKPAGMTSHDVVSRVRRLVGTRKVGHAGTLDPMATGVLILGVNRATRLLGHLALHDKTYEATIRLGQSTVTDDAEGDVVAAAGAGGLDDEAVAAKVATLTGDIEQRPSAVSAIKVDGQRSYARVRAGEQVELPARPVTVSRFDVLERRDGLVDGVAVVDLDVRVDCTTGTYIRALARDLGQALGTGGHLTALRRTRVGGFDLSVAQRLPGWDEQDATIDVLDIDTAVRSSFPWLELDEAAAREVGYGRRLPGLALPAPLAALYGPDGTFLALYRQDGPDARPEAVFTTG